MKPNDHEMETIKNAIDDKNARVFAEHKKDAEYAGDDTWYVTSDFYKFLTTFDGPWPFIKGAFEEQMASYIKGE